VKLETSFPALISRLRAIYSGEFFQLDTIVRPVALVDPITLQSSGPVFDAASSAGILVAPAAGTVLADTGPLAGGNMNLFVIVTSNGGGSQEYLIQRRNAANTANVWEQLLGSNGDARGFVFQVSFAALVNERFRLVMNSLGIGDVQGSIWII
jgi:hypothetical protein